MSNQYGIDMGNILRTVETVKSARQAREQNKQKMDWKREDRAAAKEQAQQQQERNALLARLRGRAASGDQQAQRELITLDPEGAKTFMDAYNAMDEQGKQQTKDNLEVLGRTAAYIRNSQNPEQAYQTARANLAPEVAQRMPEQYNPDWVEFSLARTQELAELTENPEMITLGGEDRLYRGGRQVEATESNALLREREKTEREAIKVTQEAAPELASSDINAIYRQSLGLFETMTDQQGNIRLLDPNKTADVQAITTEAARLYESGEASNIADAVTKAARKQGMSIRNLQGNQLSGEDLINQYVQ